MQIKGTCLERPAILECTRGHRTVTFRLRGEEGFTLSILAGERLGEFSRLFLSRGCRILVQGLPTTRGLLAREIRYI